MIIKLDNIDESVAEQIMSLQQASYKVEAELIEFDRIPPLLESLGDIRKCEEIFYGYFVDTRLAGLVSYKLNGETLDIHRVAVHPDFFRKGIARMLIGFLERNHSVNRLIVSTALKNAPAVRLYRTMNFQEVNQQEIEKDLVIISFEKCL